MKKSMLPVFTLIFAAFFCAGAFAYVGERNNALIDLEKYKMNCFLFDFFGSNATSKLQFSLKVRAIKELPLYLAYSQSLFWQLWLKSQPMYELNYNPEIFYRLDFSEKGKEGTTGLDISALENESNRVAGMGAREWYRYYVRFFQTWEFWPGEKDKPRFYLNVKLAVPYILNAGNLDILKYRGIYEIYFTWADFMKSDWFPESDLTLRLYGGGPIFINPIDGAAELTWRFKTGFFKNTLTMFYAQLFWGHAENLRDYNAPPVVKIRFGAGF